MRILSASALLLVVGCASARSDNDPSKASTAPRGGIRPDSARNELVARGVSYEYRWYGAEPWAVHEITIDPQACGIELRTMKALDHVVGRETTSSMARRAAERFKRPVLLAVNADFFSLNNPPGVSEGPQISNGELIKSEGTHREAIDNRMVRLSPVFAIDRNNNPFLTHTRLRGTLQVRGLTLPLTGINIPARENTIVVFDSWIGDATPADTGALELVVRAVALNAQTNVRRGVVISVDTAVAGVAIPKDGFVVAARGSTRTTLSKFGTGDTITWHASFDSLPAAPSELVGGYPMLLSRGKAVHHDEAGLREAFSDRRHPRIAIGIDDKRHIHVVAVDGRREGYSEGMTLEEMGNYLLARGIHDALNFDGGGSTTVVIGDRIVNRPTDSTGERLVANALIVLGAAPGMCR